MERKIREKNRQISKQNNGRKNRAGKVISATGILLLVAVIALCSLLVVPGFFGYHMYHVVSGSMEPAISVGSLIYVKEEAPEEIKEEEIIAFYSDQEGTGIITHRVVKNNVVSGTFTTKGDANAGEDPMPTAYDNLIGKVVLAVPGMGGVMTVMTSFYGKIAAACVIALGVLLNLMGSAGRKADRD